MVLGLVLHYDYVPIILLFYLLFMTSTSRVSVRNIIESGERVQNKSQANKECDTRICFTEVRFSQTYSPLRW
jgi:hypothetical protein